MFKQFRLFFSFIWLVPNLIWSQQFSNSVDTAQIRKLNKVAWDLKYENPDRALMLCDSAILLAKGEVLPALTESYKVKGVVYLLTGKFGPSISELTKALALAEKFKDSLAIGKITSNLGNVYTEIADYSKAVEFSLKSLKIMEAIGYERGILPIYVNLGNVYTEQENHNKAAEYFKRAIAIASKQNDSLSLASVKSDLATSYKCTGKYDLAFETYLQALTIFKLQNNPIGIFNLYNNLASILIAKGNYTEALNYLEQALIGKKELGDEQGMAEIIFNKGEIYRLTGKFKEAEQTYNLCKKLGEESENLTEQIMALEGLTKLAEARNDFKRAYQLKNQLTQLQDSLNNAETYDRISTYQTLYETEQKNKEIVLLSKEKELQELAIRRKNLQQIFLITGFLAAFIFSIVFFIQRKRIAREKKSSEKLLLNILPQHVATELKQTGKATSRPFEKATVLFTDFCDFTKISEKLTPEQLVTELNLYFSYFDELMSKHNVEKIKTIGDAYMAAGGLQGDYLDAALRVVAVARDIQTFMHEQKLLKQNQGIPFFEIRIGIHSGPLVAGIVGTRKFQYDIWGDTVNTASRLESAGERGKINISENTCNLIKNHFTVEHRGSIEAKGKGPISMYFVTGEI